MSRKRFYNLDNPQDVELLLNEIDDDMAVNSDANGDSDAEDDVPLSNRRSQPISPFENDDSQDEEANFTAPLIDGNNDMPEPRHLSDIEDASDSSSSSSDSEKEEVFCWKKSSTAATDFAKSSFDQPFGPSKFSRIDIVSPLNVFKNFVTYFFLHYIIDQSNRYAAQNSQQLNLTLEELKAYVGIIIIMGFHRLPSMKLYWSSDSNFGVPRIQNVMSLKRFLKITRFLHLNDNTAMPRKGENEYDKLYKVRPILDFVDKRFKRLFNPSRFLSIDESMVKYKERSSLKQYMPMKPIKRGFKIWVIACAVTGYCIGLSLYEGAEKNADKNISLGERVVNKLSASFEGMGYCLFFDNFFSSIVLAKRLLQKKFFSCATIRQTRKHFPKNKLKTDKSMSIGDTDGIAAGEISISKWKDRGKKSVSMVSTMHDPVKTCKVLRTQKTGAREEVDCPESIAAYNKYMGGVDRFDQLMSVYSISWKSKRWWLRIFYYCIDACIVNSYVLYKTTLRDVNIAAKPMTHLKFRTTLASELIADYSSRVKPGPLSQFGKGRKRNNPDGRATIPNAMRLNNVGKHIPVKGSRRRCAYCSTSKEQKRSNLICQECKVALCLPCFESFHKGN